MIIRKISIKQHKETIKKVEQSQLGSFSAFSTVLHQVLSLCSLNALIV